MRLTKPFTEPHPQRNLDDALIPLINVVFLMLIFFMLAGQIAAPDRLQVAPPVSDQGRAETPSAILVLLDAQGRAALDGEVLADDALAARVAQRLAARREQLRRTRDPRAQAPLPSNGSPALPAVTLKADAKVRHARLRRLLDQLRASGVDRVRLLAQPGTG